MLSRMKLPGSAEKKSRPTVALTPMEKRLKQRAAFAANESTLVEDIVFELSLTKTIVSITFLLLVGASLATSYILSAHPECFGHQRKVNLENQILPGEVPMLRSGSALGSAESSIKKTEKMENMIEKHSLECTSEQMDSLKTQLPGTQCESSPWTQKCSFTLATTRGCQDPLWARQFFASTDLSSPFKALFVDYLPNDSPMSDFPIDALYLGSHNTDDKKYDIGAWRQAAKVDPACKKPVTLSGKKNSAQSVVMIKDEAAFNSATRIKSDLGLTDDDMWLEHVNTESNAMVRKFIAQKFPGDEPIHYLKVNGGYSFLASWFTTNNLSKAWYLEFTANWVGDWGSGDLGLLLKSLLPKSGFVCYWAGSDEKLWRITGCWQDHYAFKTWANVACVNSGKEETKPLLDKMEALFQKTLEAGNTY
ncbi:unnamed protein product [Cylindrotheca closterium]|uniref:Uncharacterized protein n=1 Tax=Cylindrotheca closterium TaxID=2856 RepID=A0AAD2PXG0_9STRA|nr:unnamed protein product [Cylindrotheca closterium]